MNRTKKSDILWALEIPECREREANFMRICAALWAVAMAALCQAGDPARRPQAVTVVAEAEQALPAGVFAALKQETDRLFSPLGLRLEWALREEAGANLEADIIVFVRFRGRCRPAREPLPARDGQVMARTHASDGVLLPFSEVECESVLRQVRPALAGLDRSGSEILLGRALGRVVAHEILHVLLQRKDHAVRGIFRRELSLRQLVEEFPPEAEEGRISLEFAGEPAS